MCRACLKCLISLLLLLFEHGGGEERVHGGELDDGFGLGLRLGGCALLVFLMHIQMLRYLGYLGSLCSACTAHEHLIRSSRNLVAEVPLRVADERARVTEVNAATALDRKFDILRDYFAERRSTRCDLGDLLLVPHLRSHGPLNNVMRFWYWISWKKSLILKQALLRGRALLEHAHLLLLRCQLVGRAHA